MSRLEIPIGTRFGRLTATGEGEPAVQADGKRLRKIACLCECGEAVTVHLYSLRRGATKSCGCLSSKLTGERRTTHGHTKGRNWTYVYTLWGSMRRRAVTGSDRKTKNYLGRGITMYAPWRSDFQAFHDWVTENLGPRPEGCSLDRINNDGNYEPGNLRWATAEEQANNTRWNVVIAWLGETKTLAQWAREFNIGQATLRARLFVLNWPIDKALTTPVRGSKNAD